VFFFRYLQDLKSSSWMDEKCKSTLAASSTSVLLFASVPKCIRDGDEGQPMLDRLKELPSAMTTWSSSNVDHFSLLAGLSLQGGGG
jgi:hypothetical protein